MLLANVVALMLGVTLMASSVTGPADDGPDPRDVTDKQRQAAEAWLKEISKNQPLPAPPKIIAVDDAVRRLFPNDQFFAVRFMRYPRAVKPPAPLKLENLIRVHPKGRVERIRDLAALKTLLEKQLATIQSEDQSRTALLACLRLAEEFYQDGYYLFTVPQDSLSVVRRDNHWLVSGTAVVTRGGRGTITVTLTTGTPSQVVIEGKVRPDVRLR